MAKRDLERAHVEDMSKPDVVKRIKHLEKQTIALQKISNMSKRRVCAINSCSLRERTFGEAGTDNLVTISI